MPHLHPSRLASSEARAATGVGSAPLPRLAARRSLQPEGGCLMLSKLPTIAKAIAGGLVAFGASLAAALPDGVDASEWLTVAVATLAGLGIVYTVPNKKPVA